METLWMQIQQQSFSMEKLLQLTVGDVLTSCHHLPTTPLPPTPTHTRGSGAPRMLGGGGASLLLSRLNWGQAWQACGRIHTTRLFTGDVRLWPRLLLLLFVKVGAVNPTLRLLSHGNKMRRPLWCTAAGTNRVPQSGRHGCRSSIPFVLMGNKGEIFCSLAPRFLQRRQETSPY